ncbi:putative transposase-like protein [Klebsiella pneumoniae]|nr:putative transposase-like protein [Klebsiella pneumoniae]SLO64964.1 putative transposase-like protein [Klebsiella pneumoniae]SLO72780.1 putative transposase-like protein [Klebsiella pneumoniae]SLO74252.1 putative transposase-like protein [Klebsiella pneumoniae]SSJ90761.1 putative transposase-like protein [Klebsiella pneumoniae]
MRILWSFAQAQTNASARKKVLRPSWNSVIDVEPHVMSRKGCSSDNAACEGFFGRVKNEIFYGRNWAGITLEEFICFLDSYISWYNEKRIKLSLGAMSPVKYRQHLGITT